MNNEQNELQDILTAEEMRRWYGTFYDQSPRVQLDLSKVPPRFRYLLPYAEFWGLADDEVRENLVAVAPLAVRQNLRDVILPLENDFNAWLAGPESDEPELSREYIAYSALRMAADSA